MGPFPFGKGGETNCAPHPYLLGSSHFALADIFRLSPPLLRVSPRLFHSTAFLISRDANLSAIDIIQCPRETSLSLSLSFRN